MRSHLLLATLRILDHNAASFTIKPPLKTHTYDFELQHH